MSKDDKSCNQTLRYSKEILEEINRYSSNIEYKSDYINEIFLYFYIPFFEKKKIIELENSDEVELNECGDSYLWDAAALKCGLELSFRNRIFFHFKNLFFLFVSFFFVIAYSVLISLYALFRYRSLKSDCKSKITVVRAPATYQKMHFLQKEGVIFFSDSFTFNENKTNSLYSKLDLFQKILSIMYVPIYSMVDFFKVYRDAKNTVGFGLTGYVLLYFAKRIAHKCNLEFYLERYFKRCKVDVYYSGNKEDRFALLEKRLCKKFKVKCICIPHGLEYSFKMPGGLVGEQFYCTSLNAKKYLEKMYQNEGVIFYFDEQIAKKMFSREIACSNVRKIVFFPESREPEINLKIMEFLVKNDVELYVKLHVKDSVKNYDSVVNSIKLIELFDDAISHNICLARKSTVLVEALYNHSTAIAILIDDRDKSFVDLMFPSLADSNILRVESFQQLKNMLTRLKEKN